MQGEEVTSGLPVPPVASGPPSLPLGTEGPGCLLQAMTSCAPAAPGRRGAVGIPCPGPCAARGERGSYARNERAAEPHSFPVEKEAPEGHRGCPRRLHGALLFNRGRIGGSVTPEPCHLLWVMGVGVSAQFWDRPRRGGSGKGVGKGSIVLVQGLGLASGEWGAGRVALGIVLSGA